MLEKIEHKSIVVVPIVRSQPLSPQSVTVTLAFNRAVLTSILCPAITIEPLADVKRVPMKSGLFVKQASTSLHVVPAGIWTNDRLQPSKNGTTFIGAGFGQFGIRSKIEVIGICDKY